MCPVKKAGILNKNLLYHAQIATFEDDRFCHVVEINRKSTDL